MQAQGHGYDDEKRHVVGDHGRQGGGEENQHHGQAPLATQAMEQPLSSPRQATTGFQPPAEDHQAGQYPDGFPVNQGTQLMHADWLQEQQQGKGQQKNQQQPFFGESAQHMAKGQTHDSDHQAGARPRFTGARPSR